MSRSPYRPLPTAPVEDPRLANAWELHTGYVKLFIVGPGENDWFACSAAHYDGPVGTPREREIARRALAILNQDFRHARDIGRPTFDRILKQATAKTP